MGGGATRAYNVAKGLKANRCDVVVVAAFPHYPTGNIPKEYRWRILRVEYINGIRVIRTFVPPLSSRGLARRAILFLSFIMSSLLALPLIGKVDIIWAANPNILSVIPALIISTVKRCPFVLNVDDLWPEDLYAVGLLREGSAISKVAELLAKFAYTKASLITPISPGYVRVISGKYGVCLKKIHVVRAGVDIRKFKPAREEPRGKNCFTVLYSGAFSISYDFDQVLEAAKLLENYKDIEFVLQGGGELTDYIKGRVAKLRVNNVRVVDRILSRDEVAKLLCEADALILPLRDFGKPYLGIPSKLYEYQAAGKPIICCAEGQPAEYLSKTKSGIVVKPGDFKKLAEAVILLKENKQMAEKLGISGRQYVEANLSIERIAREMINAFMKLKT